ncbi:MAG: O-antigen ligase family protein [Deltaproteobacteria bacterium]|nr:O-antigen ligase family protein [Deltaproteobacteria bacterium]
MNRLLAVLGVLGLGVVATALILSVTQEPTLVVGGLLGLCYCVLVVARNDWALSLLVVSFSMLHVFLLHLPGSILSVTDTLLLAYCSITLLMILFDRRKKLSRENLPYLAVFMLIAAISITVSTDLRNSIAFYLRICLVLSFHFIVLTQVATEKQIKNLIVCYIAAVLLMILMNTNEIAKFTIVKMVRFKGASGNPNILGGFTGSALILVVYFLLYAEKRINRIISLFLVLFFGTTLLFTYSRWSWISFFCIFIYWMYLNRVNRPALMLLTFISLIFFVFDDQLLEIFQRRGLTGDSTRNRLLNYSYGLRAIVEYPLLGIGFDQYDSLYSYIWLPMGAYKRAPHSLYIKIGVEVGIIGLAVFVYTLLRMIVRLVTRIAQLELKDSERMYLNTLYILAVHQLLLGFSTSNLNSPAFWLFFALVNVQWSLLGKRLSRAEEVAVTSLPSAPPSVREPGRLLPDHAATR